MPKFLVGCHYNEEEISWHLKNYRILAGPNEWQQVCNRSNPGKTGRSYEGADFRWLSSKVSRTLRRILFYFILLIDYLTKDVLLKTPHYYSERYYHRGFSIPTKKELFFYSNFATCHSCIG
jgi:hypothetical protein